MILLLWSCGPQAPEIEPDTGTPPPDPTTFTGFADRAGYEVQSGELWFMDPEDCCGTGAECLFINPSAPPGSYRLPPAPDQALEAPQPYPTHTLFYLRPDEAVVFLSTVPPARYFSLRSYLWSRAASAYPEFGSLGPTVNPLSGIPDDGDPSLAVVTTADLDTEAEVIGLLEEAGWDPSHIQVDRIPAGDAELGLRPGVTADADLYTQVARVTLFDDDGQAEAYRADPGQVLRLTPRTPRTATALHQRQPLPPLGTGEAEVDRSVEVDALSAAIHAAYPDHIGIEVASDEVVVQTYDCIVNTPTCFGENNDALYRVTPPFLLPSDNVFLVAFGVNHEATGKATYTNLAVQTVENTSGVADVDSSKFPASAEAWQADAHPDLFAWTVARNCDAEHLGDRPCVEVPTGCPGVDLAGLMFITFRSYLEPATGGKPLASELEPDRAILFVPRL